MEAISKTPQSDVRSLFITGDLNWNTELCSAMPDFLQGLITVGVEIAPVNRLFKKFFLSISNKLGEILIKYVKWRFL
ncbi:hypothetical protein [Pedobacter chitinilyticus]|uniref:Uncharacterized protein n=1 Tax=Pedobacter chitinilyticus TaxID=2233776 RepID=A0A443YRG4_9SPHI|nr:hypothetical protein [Pedobacter chitinilyticus]RWU06384.1 hypothetical protein DPV69_13940 [Pedobacter chitinilyticus]